MADGEPLTVAEDVDDDALLRAFEAATIDPKGFDHRAHLRIAWIHFDRFEPDEALSRIRDGLRANLAAAVKRGYDPPVGYHETITVFWFRVTAAAAEGSRAAGIADSCAFLDANSWLVDKKLLLRHYSRERVMSDEARARFIEPDLLDLPTPCA